MDPWGEQRGDMRTAMLAAMVSSFGGKRRKPKEFMLFPERDRRKQSSESMISELRKLKGFLGGKHNR